jgi:hypothetical protein
VGRHKLDREPKRKAVKIRIAPRENAGQVTEPYRIMEEILASDRKDLAGVNIGIAWHTGWRPDADNVRTRGKAVKHGELERSRSNFDWSIELSEPVWKALDEKGKYRLISHELEHIQICSDKNGCALLDDKNRVVTRARKHDFADFVSIFRKFGLPENLIDCDIADADRPLLKLVKEESGPATASEASHAPQEPPSGEPQTIAVKFHGLKRITCVLFVRRDIKGWRCGYEASIGNYETIEGVEDTVPFPVRELAIQAAYLAIDVFFSGLPETGTVDQKRANGRRVGQAREQIREQLQPYMPASVSNAGEVPFEEDNKPNTTEPQDDDRQDREDFED